MPRLLDEVLQTENLREPVLQHQFHLLRIRVVLQAESQHGQVVVLFRLTGKVLHAPLQCTDDVLCRQFLHAFEGRQQTFHGVQLLRRVLRLGQSVGVEQQEAAVIQTSGLRHVVEVLEYTYRYIGQAGQQARLLPRLQEHRGIVPRIAVIQFAGCRVEHSDEQGDEHVRLVVVRHRTVQGSNYFTRRLPVNGNRTEQASGNRHQQ